jgi:hypothetical protein
MLWKQLILTNSVPNIAKKSSHGQKMRLPPTKISLPVKNNVDNAFVFVGNTNQWTKCQKIILTFSEILKNRFRNDSSSDIDYSVKTIWNTTGKLLQEKCHDEYKLSFNLFCDVVPNVCLNCSFGNLPRQI